jgi:phosphoribosylanthranilate isomerase
MRTAEALGAAYVGMVVEVARSPRSLSRAQARVLAKAARVPSVMVTTATDPGAIADLAEAVGPAVIQLHGPAGPGLVARVREEVAGAEVWYVVAVDVGEGLAASGKFVAEAEAAGAAGAARVVVDSARGGESGGTGLAASWDIAAAIVEALPGTPVVLAGGLRPGNVAEAIRAVRPAGVDVSSGVEAAPGLKSAALMAEFLRNVIHVT